MEGFYSVIFFEYLANSIKTNKMNPIQRINQLFQFIGASSLLLIFSLVAIDLSSQDLIERTKKGVNEQGHSANEGTRIFIDIQTIGVESRHTIDNLFDLNSKTPNAVDERQHLSISPVYLTINPNALSQMHSSISDLFELNIPVNKNHAVNLILKEHTITSESFVASTNQGTTINHSNIRTYRGYIEGDASSTVSMTISKDNLSLLISDIDGNYSLGQYNGSKSEYVFLNDNSLIEKTEFNCGSDNLISKSVSDNIINYDRSSTIGCLDVYLEVSNDIFTHQGGATEQTLFFVMSMFNQTANIFCIENIDINISDVVIWTTPDPYESLTTMDAILDAFSSNTQNAFDGDLAHILIGGVRGSVSGLAWIDVIGVNYNPACNTSSGPRPCGPYGVSGLMNSPLNNYPTYSSSVSTFAHELGHNFGSLHTHSCVWNGNNTAIDGCGPVVGCSNPGPTSNGTIMSYCSGYPLTNGFGPQPGNVIRNGLTTAINNNLIDGSCSCSVPCAEDFVLASYGSSYPVSWSFLSPRMFGDVDGDSKDDVIGFASTGLRVSLSTGNDIVYDNTWDLPNFGLASGGWNTNSHPRRVVDVDGDGKADIVGFAAAGVHVATSTGTNFNSPTVWVNGYGISNGWTVDNHPRIFGDYNNDGLNDFVGFANGLTITVESNGSSFVRNSAFDLAHFHLNQGWSSTTPRLVGDVDGDGFDDDIVGFGPNQVQVATSNGSSFDPVTNWTTNFTASEGWSTNFHLRFLADVDGDGKDDIVGFAHEGVRVGISDGTSFAPQDPWIAGYGVNQGWTVANHPRFMTDYNGDGMADIIGFANAGVYVSLSTGTSFDTPILIQSCYGFNDGWSDIDYVRGHADFSGNGQQEIVAMGCGGTFIHFVRNDDSSTAHQLTVSSTCTPITENNTGLSASGELPSFSCGNAGSTIDAWYTVEIPPSGNIMIETTQVTGGLTDMVMQVLSGTSGSFTEIACSDDDGTGTHALVSLSGRTPGEIIYVRVVDFGSNDFGEFGICAHDDTVVNNNCPPNYAGTNQLTGTQSTIADYETNGVIESDQIIDANVDYDSGTEIDLLSGFEVKLGKIFHAFIDGCGNLFKNDDDTKN